ncbi:MAG: metal-dependent hydrolase [Candidatus Anstonellaceae archaeon]
MKWQAHLLFGLVAGAALGWLLRADGWKLASICAISGFFSLLPDIDLDSSKISQIMRLFLVLVAIALGLMFRSLLVAFLLLAGTWAAWVLFRPRHRGITHTLIFALVCFAAGFALFGWQEGLAAFVGVASHIAADKIGK